MRGPSSDEATDADEDELRRLLADVPPPTFVPAAMALGITLFAWGFITSPVILAMGLLVTAASFVAWLRELRHEG